MPTRAEHLVKAEHNEALAGLLEDTRYADWAVTALFYAALHLVDAFLLTLGMDPKDHGERWQQIARSPALRTVWTRYRSLLDRSVDARYECQPFTPTQVRALRQNTFAPVKHHLSVLLGL